MAAPFVSINKTGRQLLRLASRKEMELLYSALQSVITYTVGLSKGAPIMAAACSL